MPFHIYKDLKINEDLRRELSRPFGKVLSSNQIVNALRRSDKIYAVVDVTVATLLKLGYKLKVAIFDYKTARSKVVFNIIKSTYMHPIKVRNRRGVLSVSLWSAVKKAARSERPTSILVSGEEDLGALACIHFAKVGSKVMYGLRGKGMVMILVNRKMKKYVSKTLIKMISV